MISKVKTYIKRNAAALFYVCAALCIMAQLMTVVYHFNLVVDYDWMSHVRAKTLALHIANAFADALILLLPFVLLPACHKKWGWIVIWLVAAWGTAQLFYLPTYRDVMPFSSFLLTENVGSTLLTSAMGEMSKSKLEPVIPAVLLYLIYRLWLKKGIETSRSTRRKRLWLTLLSLVAFVAIRLGVTAVHYHSNDEESTLSGQITADYGIMWTRQGDYINNNGLVPYAGYNLWLSLMSHATLTADEKSQVDNFLKRHNQYTDTSFATAQGKNVIFIVVESLNSWVLNLKVSGREVTPTLNALCADTASNLVCVTMKPQVKNGRSSDGIFMYNTGLLPLATKAVANTYSSNRYPTLAKSLGGYDCLYACCDEPSLWNVSVMAANYGYRDFYGRADIDSVIKSNGYLPDKALLEEVASLLPGRKQPFMALVATAGMHHPYTTPLEPETWIQREAHYSVAVKCYMERAAEFDTRLGEFLQALRDRGLWDNTMIVIASDHNEMVDDDRRNGRPTLDPEGDNCTLVIVNSGQHGLINGPIGQIDVYPTLLDLLGLNSGWKGLGQSILRNNVTAAATSTASVTGTGGKSDLQEAWRVSDLIITGNYFKPQN